MGKFQDKLVVDVSDIPLLPLLHTCDAYSFRSMLETMSLIPQKCSVFDAELLYTYYGVPSYRSNYSLATNQSSYYPICIILNSSKLTDFHKVYPFDSGAFETKSKLKESFFHHRSQIIDYELAPNITSPKRVIKTFYQCNDNYISEKPDVSAEFGLLDFEALSYKAMISSDTNSEFDNRTSSIEVIFDKEIELNKNTVKQIIIPKCFMDDKDISKLVKDNFGISTPLTYSTFRGMPKEYFSVMRDRYLNFMESEL